MGLVRKKGVGLALMGLLLLACVAASGQEDFEAERERTRRLPMTPAQLSDLEVLRLQGQIRQKDPAIRIQAIRGLANIGGETSVMVLRDVADFEREKDKAVRIEAVKALGRIGSLPDSRITLQVLSIALDDPDETVRKRAVQAFRNTGTAHACPYLGWTIQNDRNVGVRLEAVDMLQRIGTHLAIPPLERAIRDPIEGVRAKAADALGKIGELDRSIAPILGAAFATEKSVGVKLQIVGALGMVRERAGLEYLQVAMADKNPTIRKHATEVYSRVIAFK
jgi:HEAT repeat protein